MDEDVLLQIEQIIQYDFQDKQLLINSLTHSSAVDDRLSSNERLEFFGDSILGFIISEVLFERFEEYLEGDLTKIKSMLVSRNTCSKVSSKLKLQKFLKVGKGMEGSQAISGSLAAGLLEAIIAAIYLDGGLNAAKDFILRSFGFLIEQADAKHSQGNYKSLLQQYSQQHFNSTPVYELLDEKGPDHNKCFESAVTISGRHYPSAWGTNKKEAEQKAAYRALVELKVIKDTSKEEE